MRLGFILIDYKLREGMKLLYCKSFHTERKKSSREYGVCTCIFLIITATNGVTTIDHWRLECYFSSDLLCVLSHFLYFCMRSILHSAIFHKMNSKIRLLRHPTHSDLIGWAKPRRDREAKGAHCEGVCYEDGRFCL